MTPPSDVETMETSDPGSLETNPLVSVVVLAYNHEAYIVDALESILAQQRDFAIEILVGDDHSTDNTLSIALEYQRRYPSLFRVLSADANVGMNRNHFRLLRAARGCYIAYCEGDDFWNTSQKLARQVRFLQDRPCYGLVHSDYSRTVWLRRAWRVRKNVNGVTGLRPPEGSVFDALLRANFVSTGTTVVRTEAVHHYLDSWHDKALAFPVGDWPLWLHVSRGWKVGYLDEDLATYRLTPGSVTNSGVASDIRRNRALVDMLGEMAEAFGTSLTATETAQAALVHHVLYLAWRSGDRINARWAMGWFEQHQQGVLTAGSRLKFSLFDKLPILMTPYGALSAVLRRARELRVYRTCAVLPSSRSSHG